MATKKYIGKKLKPPYDGPQTSQKTNPAKKAPAAISHGEIQRLLKLLRKCTDPGQLERIARTLTTQQLTADKNARLPDTVTIVHWEGHLAHETIRCGKAGCKCNEGHEHGPYWYLYKRRS